MMIAENNMIEAEKGGYMMAFFTGRNRLRQAEI